MQSETKASQARKEHDFMENKQWHRALIKIELRIL